MLAQKPQALDKYWLLESPEKVVAHLDSMTTSWDCWGTNAIRNAWVRNYSAYYSAMIKPSYMNSSMVYTGEQGELVSFSTPIARTYIRQLVSIVTKQRQSYEASAMTSGSDVIASLKLANGLSDEIVQSQRLDTKSELLVEGALVMGASFLRTAWNTAKGKPHIRDENGKIIMTGSVDMTVLSVFDTFYNPFIPHWDDQPVVICRVLKNRWDLMADFPDIADEIARLPSYAAASNNYIWMGNVNLDDDMVWVYEMYARVSPALPEGRMMMFSDAKTVYYNGANQYKTIPIEPMIPEPLMTMSLGYPKITDLMACQELYDTVFSTYGTNFSQFGVQSVAVPRGSDIDVNELNGMRFVSYTPQNVPNSGVPTPLQLTQSPAEGFKFAEMLSGAMQQMSLLNGALTGNLPQGVTSGTAIATLSANAIEFLSSVSKAMHVCLEKSMEHAINCYKYFAQFDQDIQVDGRGGKKISRKFKGDDLVAISGIKILISNPLMQTIAGRLEIGEKLMAMPRDLWPMYTSILEGRNFKEIFKGEVSEMDLVYMENEKLRDGQEVMAAITDDHALHIMEHKGLIADPDIRSSSQHLQKITEHMLMHEELAQKLQNENPLLLAMLRTGKMPEGGIPAPQGQGAPSAPPTGPQAPPLPDVAEPAADQLGRGGQ